MSIMFGKFDIIDAVRLEVGDFESGGKVLDIGGGGEGVIGRLKGRECVAIDLYEEELAEAPDGFEKLVMDARDMKFPDGNFGSATAFFSFMYMGTEADHGKVAAETHRVLKPGGTFRIWDIDTGCRPASKKDRYLARVRYKVGAYEKTTAYGVRWPQETRDEAYYRRVVCGAGFGHERTERTGDALYLEFVKR